MSCQYAWPRRGGIQLCSRIRWIGFASSMLAITWSRPPQRRQRSMSITNTRLSRCTTCRCRTQGTAWKSQVQRSNEIQEHTLVIEAQVRQVVGIVRKVVADTGRRVSHRRDEFYLPASPIDRSRRPTCRTIIGFADAMLRRCVVALLTCESKYGINASPTIFATSCAPSLE